eukprot:2690531-Amphidinium_carterae.1
MIQNSPTSSYGLGHLPLKLADLTSPTNVCKRCILVMDELPARPDMDSILFALQGRTVPEVAPFSCNRLPAHVADYACFEADNGTHTALVHYNFSTRVPLKTLRARCAGKLYLVDAVKVCAKKHSKVLTFILSKMPGT